MRLQNTQEVGMDLMLKSINMPAKSKVDREIQIGSKVYVLNDYNIDYKTINEIKRFLSPKEWQRLISELAIKGYGSLKPYLLKPIIIAIRPNGKVVIIDGQHRVALILNTLDEKNFPKLVVQEYVHDINLSENECKKIESAMFKGLNTKLKSLNKMTIIRSGVVHEDPEALWVLTVLGELNLHIDNFGSEKSSKMTLAAPSGLYQLLYNTTARFKYNTDPLVLTKNLNTLKQGMKRYKEKWGKGGDKDFDNGIVHGALLNACVLEHEYSTLILENGTKEDFDNFCCGGGFTFTADSASLKKMIGSSGACDKIYMGWLIDRYRKYGTKSGKKNSIGEETFKKCKLKKYKRFDFTDFLPKN
jgi:hypothetical protein